VEGREPDIGYFLLAERDSLRREVGFLWNINGGSG